jgi:hypothetical protein
MVFFKLPYCLLPYIADSPQSNETETATFADDTAIFVSSGDPEAVFDILIYCYDTLILSPRFKQWKM